MRSRSTRVEPTREVIGAGRANGFRSINMDLIFGLPKQTLEGFATTLERVIECDPDRIGLYAYAHVPTVFKPQPRSLEEELLTPARKLARLPSALRRMVNGACEYRGRP